VIKHSLEIEARDTNRVVVLAGSLFPKWFEKKKPRKIDNIENMMNKYLEMRSKQVEDEAAREKETREKEAAQSEDFSIKRCISVLNTMEEVTKLEKAKAYLVFTKSKENRDFHMCMWSGSRISFDLA
jgi:adenylyl- and sulfurtransferase ThiI